MVKVQHEIERARQSKTRIERKRGERQGKARGVGMSRGWETTREELEGDSNNDRDSNREAESLCESCPVRPSQLRMS